MHPVKNGGITNPCLFNLMVRIYEMLLAHEHQHNETMLQLLQMVDGYEPVEHDPEPAAEPVKPTPPHANIRGSSYYQ